MNLHFSPMEFVKTCKRKLGLLVEDDRPPIRGLVAASRERLRLADIAEQFVQNLYYPILIEKLEYMANELYAEFEAGKIEKETFFRVNATIKDISEHPYKLMQQGREAQATMQEWDEQGLTAEVADADAALARGGQ